MVITNISQPSPPSATSASPSLGGTIESTNTTTATGVVIPVYSSWFDFTKVNEIERRSLPEFFTNDNKDPQNTSHANMNSGGKSAEMYMEYRDFMIQQYRVRPKEYLTVTMCRRHLTGDVGSIVRVHAFLEQWGLINFQAELPAGAKRERSLQVLSAQLDIPKALSSTMEIAKGQSTITDVVTMDEKKKKAVDSGKIICACGAECPRLYYTQKNPSSQVSSLQINLCGLCYAEGRFPTALHSDDFVQVDLSKVDIGLKSPWSEEETLLLLSSIEKHPNNWSAVSHLVGRPVDQCIFHFLKLPSVEGLDKMQMRDVSDNLTGSLPTSGMPFAAFDNPIISTLAFLASSVHPKVAAAAAQAALEQSQTLKNNNSTIPPNQDDLAQVAAVGIACAAARADKFADEEASKSVKSRESILELQLHKLRVKMALYEELEHALELELKELEHQRLRLFLDRYNMRKQVESINTASNNASNNSASASASASARNNQERMQIDEGNTEATIIPVTTESKTVHL